MNYRKLSAIGIVVAGVMLAITGLTIFAWSVLAFCVGLIADSLLREVQD